MMTRRNDFSSALITCITSLVLFLAWIPAQARNVDLSTVPQRATVQLTIYNSEDLTLVRETRTITFKKGNNPLQFSWANTLIDPSSVELRFPDDDTLDVIDTTFPHDRPQVLYWNVQSSDDREAMIEISYFTSGITWSADYDAIVDAEETSMRLSSFVRVHNTSGEDYEDAQVRLVVGTINLVEKIAQLAQLPAGKVKDLEEGRRQVLRKRAARKMMAQDQALSLMAEAAAPSAAEQPKQIVKEGLSEYFIYTIEGTETVPHGWSKRLRSFAADTVPLEIEYRYRLRQYGDQLVRILELKNDSDSGLGNTPLPNGEVRVFRDNGNGGLRFLARQTIKYVAIGDKIELNLGNNPDVLFELVTRNAYRDNIWLQLRGGRLYQRADEPGVRIDINSKVAGWDEHTVYSQRIRNYSGRPISVEIRREFAGDVTFRSELGALKHDFRTVEFRSELAAGEKADLFFEIIQRQEYNQKQQRVEIEIGAVRL